MQQKPEAFSTFFAETFKQPQVVADYRFRPPYPEEVFTILSSFLVDEPRTILDVGTGSGDIARPCTTFASRVDAVDISQEMIALGKQLPGGDNSRLHWIYGHIEDVPLNPPYALITAGSSIHWPDWSRTFPRFREMLTPNGYLAILYHNTLPAPWDAELKQLREQYGIQRNARSISAVTELEARGFIHVHGRKQTTPAAFQQTVDGYIRDLNSHSHIARAREQMSQQQTAEFDEQVSAILLRHHPSGLLPLQIIARITYCIIPDILT
jgi:SAM-dependent methyltransferase